MIINSNTRGEKICKPYLNFLMRIEIEDMLEMDLKWVVGCPLCGKETFFVYTQMQKAMLRYPVQNATEIYGRLWVTESNLITTKEKKEHKSN